MSALVRELAKAMAVAAVIRLAERWADHVFDRATDTCRATNANRYAWTEDFLALAGALDSTARITVPIGHGLKPGMTVKFSQDIGGPRMVTSVTATTVVIRNLTRRERLTAWLREVRYRVVRLWWRACDAVGSRVA